MRLVLAMVLAGLALPLSANAQAAEELPSEEPALQLKLDDAGVEVAPTPPRTADGYTLEEIPNRSVDLVFASLVLHHCFEDACRSYMKEASRVVRPGGHFLFTLGWREPHEPRKEIAADNTYAGRTYTYQEIKAMLGPLMKIVDITPPLSTPNVGMRQLLTRRKVCRFF